MDPGPGGPVPLSPTHVTHLATADTARAARVLNDIRSATLSGRPAPIAPRPVIEESWTRMLRGGVDPDHDFRSGLLAPEEVQRRRESTPLRHVLPVLREGLLSVADVAHHIMVVADEDGRVLWRGGSPPALRQGGRPRVGVRGRRRGGGAGRHGGG